MPKVTVLDMAGKEVSKIDLSDAVFGIEPNKAVMHDMVKNYLANQRQGTQSALTRAEVSGGGKKPWRQKGTGRARQGSIRAPQWRGGGVVFGPTPDRNYKLKMNRKVRRLALNSALGQKVIDSELTVLDTIAFDAPKTKAMVKVLESLEANRKTLIVMDEVNENVALSARNIPGVKVIDSKGLNVYDILDSTKLVMTEGAIKAVEEVLA